MGTSGIHTTASREFSSQSVTSGHRNLHLPMNGWRGFSNVELARWGVLKCSSSCQNCGNTYKSFTVSIQAIQSDVKEARENAQSKDAKWSESTWVDSIVDRIARRVEDRLIDVINGKTKGKRDDDVGSVGGGGKFVHSRGTVESGGAGAGLTAAVMAKRGDGGGDAAVEGAESGGGPAPADDIDDDVDDVDSGGESLEDDDFDIGLKAIGGGRDGGKKGRKKGGKVGVKERARKAKAAEAAAAAAEEKWAAVAKAAAEEAAKKVEADAKAAAAAKDAGGEATPAVAAAATPGGTDQSPLPPPADPPTVPAIAAAAESATVSVSLDGDAKVN